MSFYVFNLNLSTYQTKIGGDSNYEKWRWLYNHEEDVAVINPKFLFN